MKTKIYCLLIIWLSVLCHKLLAQSYMTVYDCELLRSKFLSSMPFYSNSWIRMSCGNDYMLKELTHAQLETTVLLQRHVLGIHLSHNGYSKYGELKTKVSYAMKFGNKVAVGVSFDYIYQHVACYEAQHSVTFALSLFSKISRKISIGFEVYNPARLKYGLTGKTVIPMCFSLSSIYQFDDKLIMSIKLYKQLPGLFDVSVEACYNPTNIFYLSLAASLQNAEFGVMIRYRHLYFTADAKYNYNLGFAPEVGVLYQLPTLAANKGKNNLKDENR